MRPNNTDDHSEPADESTSDTNTRRTDGSGDSLTLADLERLIDLARARVDRLGDAAHESDLDAVTRAESYLETCDELVYLIEDGDGDPVCHDRDATAMESLATDLARQWPDSGPYQVRQGRVASIRAGDS